MRDVDCIINVRMYVFNVFHVFRNLMGVKALRADRRGFTVEAEMITKTGGLRRCVVIRCLFMKLSPWME